MRKLLILLLLLSSLGLFAQKRSAKKVPVTLPKDQNYTFLSRYYKINNTNEEVYLMAIAKNHNSGYALIIEHKLINFSYHLLDTAGINMNLTVYIPKKTANSSWMQEDVIFLKKSKIQPERAENKILVAFDLPDSIVFDIKGKHLGDPEFVNITKTKDGIPLRITSSVGGTIQSEGNKIFIENAAKLVSAKGSFDSALPYKQNPIPFYSLMLKTQDEIEHRLGKPVEIGKVVDGPVENVGKPRLIYQTPEGKYIINFSNNTSYEITIYPTKKFQFIEKDFFINKYPIELTNCNCGAYTSDTGGGNQSYFEIINSYQNRTQHRIKFNADGRYLQYVKVSLN
jgi:hypothetical protein